MIAAVAPFVAAAGLLAGLVTAEQTASRLGHQPGNINTGYSPLESFQRNRDHPPEARALAQVRPQTT